MLANTPGTGKLHHRLGLLSREKDGEDLRSMLKGQFWISCYRTQLMLFSLV